MRFIPILRTFHGFVDAPKKSEKYAKRMILFIHITQMFGTVALYVDFYHSFISPKCLVL